MCLCLIDATHLAQLGFVSFLCCVFMFSLGMSLLHLGTSKEMSLGCDEYSIYSLQPRFLVRFYYCNKSSYSNFVPMRIARFNSRLFG